MKQYFLPLIDYDLFCNRLMLDAIIKAGEPAQAVKLMAHILCTQQVWLNRCKSVANLGTVVIWPDWNVAEFTPYLEANHAAWREYIENNDLSRRLAYKNSKGLPFENTPVEILTHVINHGTHHRAQIGQQLKLSNIESLPVTDYIAWKWSQQPTLI